MPCGWCLTHDHLAHADGVAPASCGCWCIMSTTRVVQGQNTAWRYRCEACGFRRSGHRDEMDDIRSKHEEDCMADQATLRAAWRQLDEKVAAVATAYRAQMGDTLGAHGDAELALEQARAAAKSAAEMLSVFTAIPVDRIAREASDRAAAIARGEQPAERTPREVNERWAG